MKVENIFNEKISVYKNFWDTVGTISDIKTVLASLKKLEAKTEEGRELRKISKDKYSYFKQQMPGATFCGTFSYRRLENQTSKTHTIVLDIDHLSEQGLNMNEVKDFLMTIPSIYYCQSSLSGDGVWALAAINCNKEAAFNYYEKLLSSKNITLDKLPDATRLRALNYDKYAKLKTSNIEFLVINNTNKVSLPKKLFSNININASKDVEFWRKKSLSWDVTSYEEWLKKCYCLASQLGEDGRQIFLELSQRSGNYKSEKEVNNMYTRTLKKLRK